MVKLRQFAEAILALEDILIRRSRIKAGSRRVSLPQGKDMAEKDESLEAELSGKSGKKEKSLPRSRLVTYVDRLAEELRKSLGHSFEGDIEAIHDSRVTTRRLKSVVDLFESHLSARLKGRFSKSLKRIRRLLGNVRDLDVMIEHVHTAKGIDAETAGFLLGCLKREREDEIQTMNELNAAKILGKLGSWWGIREQIQDDLALTLLQESLTVRLDEFCRQADLHSGVEVLQDTNGLSKLNPHELRIIGKALRYTLEMAVEEGVRVPAPVMRTFKRTQSLLGLWHDHVVLTGKVLEICVDEKLNYTQPALLKKCLAFGQACARHSESRLKEFYKLWKKQGVELKAQISEALEQAMKAHEETGAAESQLEEALAPEA
jgi:CHAD domain-containing protein